MVNGQSQQSQLHKGMGIQGLRPLRDEGLGHPSMQATYNSRSITVKGKGGNLGHRERKMTNLQSWQQLQQRGLLLIPLTFFF